MVRKWLVMRGGSGQAGGREVPGHEGRPASHRVESAGPCDRPPHASWGGGRDPRGRSSRGHPLHASIVFL